MRDDSCSREDEDDALASAGDADPSATLLISCMGDRDGPRRMLVKWSVKRRLPDEAAAGTSEGEGARPTPPLDTLASDMDMDMDSLGEDRVEEEGLFAAPLRPALCRWCGRWSGNPDPRRGSRSTVEGVG